MTDYKTLFETITRSERYQRNLDWGKPRAGHSEGTVRAHIAELSSNLDQFRSRVSETDYWRLLVLIHVHDTFKGESSTGAIASPNSHASLAKAFLAEFCTDEDLQAM